MADSSSDLPSGTGHNDSHGIQTTESPPTTLIDTLKRIGPGMIIAGSIVGSGELIATTKVGAEAGFWLLWLIIIGCVIKVFAQVEFGRYTMAYSETPLKALDGVPGPRLKVNWLIWYWAIMTALIVTQQGGIVGGIGQALTISVPLTERGREFNQIQDDVVKAKVELAKLYVQYTELKQEGIFQGRIAQLQSVVDGGGDDADDARADLDQLLTLRREIVGAEAESQFEQAETNIRVLAASASEESEPQDAYLWAAILAIITAVILYVGKYGFIQLFSTVMVVSFTLVTIFTLLLLQTKPDWAVQGQELVDGMSFRLPPIAQAITENPLATALATFGIIGVGASELIAYPYWCLEKGYARFTGIRDDSPEWAERARGWMRVMRVDCWVSMVVYTFATIAFYLLGAAVLGRVGMNPEKGDMVRTLAEMYVPVFGTWAHGVFLFGAFAVLYSTYFVAAAANARMIADAFGLFGLTAETDEARQRWTRIVGVLWALAAAVVFWIVGLLMEGQSPAAMVMASALAQAIMLPMLGVAALYFRYVRCDKNLRPSLLWDLMLLVSCIGLGIAGTWAAVSNLMPLFR